MEALSSRERVNNFFYRKPLDQVPVFESFWQETVYRWIRENKIAVDENKGNIYYQIVEHFEIDFFSEAVVNKIAKLDFEPVVIDENEDTVVMFDGNGATLRRHKHNTTTPEHVDFTVKDRQTWQEHIKPHLVDFNRERINFEGYRNLRDRCKDNDCFFAAALLAPFECIHPVCGHEYMLMGMVLDPDWVKDMFEVYVDLHIKHFEVLFDEEGLPDGVFIYEDMGFKDKPFFSPDMYREIILPYHKRLIDFFHSKGLKVMMHSCGFVEPLIPGLIEAGIDCLQAMEVKAGMDMPRLFKKYGDKINFCGNMDIRELISNDKSRIEAELRKKMLPVLEGGGWYMLHSDHSIPPEVDYESYKFFVEKGREISREFYKSTVRC